MRELNTRCRGAHRILWVLKGGRVREGFLVEVSSELSPKSELLLSRQSGEKPSKKRGSQDPWAEAGRGSGGETLGWRVWTWELI